MPFTEAQQSAITAQNPNLLISAAAGSGKTAVMIERIVDQIENHNRSIDNMLIVTFTRAAASELRDRLTVRFSNSEEPLLMKQLNLIETAQISTLHSYCSNVVKKYFEYCNIDPQFRILENRISKIIYEETRELILDELYEKKEKNEIERSLLAKFNEREISVMLDEIYRFAMTRPNPIKWLDKQGKDDISVEIVNNSILGKFKSDTIQRGINVSVDILKKIEGMIEDKPIIEKYKKTIDADKITLEKLQSALEIDVIHGIEALSTVKFAVKNRVKAETSDEAEAMDLYSELRDEMKKEIMDLKKDFVVELDAEVNDMKEMQNATIAISQLTIQFHEKLMAKKREVNALDFNDLEHIAIELLDIPVIRKNEAKRFDCVFVDEYQDTSEMQSTLLEALRRYENTDNKQSYFYVGDVKQSIYRFRQAEPRLFLSKLMEYDHDENAEKRKIMLNNNFRSSESVIASVNRVFEGIMKENITEIEYDEDQRLYAGLPSKNNIKTSLHVFEQIPKNRKANIAQEAEFVGRDILKSIEKGELQYKDIAILTPVVSGVSDVVESTLKAMGIPVYCDVGSDVYQSDEVVQLASYLKLLNNVQNDIALISVLRSALCNFTDQMLSEIRKEKPEKTTSFYMAMVYVADQGKNTKLKIACKNVLDMLEEERFTLGAMSLGEYIWDFMMRSGLYAYYGAQENGSLRQANLRMICHLATSYEQDATGGIDGFIESISEDINAKNDISPTIMNPWENVVRLMSIHKSKGLEFPTVYLIQLGNAINKRVNTSLISIDDKIGIGMQYRNEVIRCKRKVLTQKATETQRKIKERSERVRLLYVAMTRPKTRLIMVGTIKKVDEEYQKVIKQKPLSINTNDIYSAHSMLSWLLLTVNDRDNIANVENQTFSTFSTIDTWKTCEYLEESVESDEERGKWNVVFHKNVENLSKTSGKPRNIPQFEGLSVEKQWENIVETVIPTKQSTMDNEDALLGKLQEVHQPFKIGVTALSTFANVNNVPLEGLFFEEEKPEQKRMVLPTISFKKMDALSSVPSFIMESEKHYGILTGIHTHRLMSELPLELLRNASDNVEKRKIIEDTKNRLINKNLIPQEESSLCKTKNVENFINSELGKRMLASNEVHREWAYNQTLGNEHNTITQGVVDLCFMEGDSWILVDFKTDRNPNVDELIAKYRMQISLYSEAISTITGIEVKEAYLYALMQEKMIVVKG